MFVIYSLTYQLGANHVVRTDLGSDTNWSQNELKWQIKNLLKSIEIEEIANDIKMLHVWPSWFSAFRKRMSSPDILL